MFSRCYYIRRGCNVMTSQEKHIKYIQDFVEAIIRVYEEYNLSLGHEDHQGAFLIESASLYNEEWLRDAFDHTDKGKMYERVEYENTKNICF